MRVVITSDVGEMMFASSHKAESDLEIFLQRTVFLCIGWTAVQTFFVMWLMFTELKIQEAQVTQPIP